MPVESGLPLGLIAEAPYGDSVFEFGSKDQLTLITDGVVEARSSQGELFGFERAVAIANAPALSIAEAAKAFGQEDDITVLIAGPESNRRRALPQVEPSGWSPAPA